MYSPSEVLSFAPLGKVVVGKEKNKDSIHTGDLGEMDSHQDPFGDKPPSKKKKRSCA